MFASLFKKAQATVDNAVSQVVNRLVVVVPFVVALGFATAAAFNWLSESYGTQVASLLLALGYAAIGGILALSIYPTSSDDGQSTTSLSSISDDAPASRDADADGAGDGMDGLDQELLMKTLASAAPVAVPVILRNVVRNLPILLAVASAAFVLSRADAGAEETEPTSLQAAE